MIKVLKAINQEMTDLKLNYAFDNWTSKLKIPYWVGEISEDASVDEDGKTEYEFMITGTDVKSFTNLFNVVESIKNRYKYGKRMLIDNTTILVLYENMIIVPVQEEGIKRVQINLNVKVWEN